MKITIIGFEYFDDCDLTEEQKDKIADDYLGVEYVTDDVENDELFEEVNAATGHKLKNFTVTLQT